MKAEDWGMSKGFKALYDTLTEQQKKFWLHYWQSSCKSQRASATAAGYKAPGVTGSTLCKCETGRRLIKYYLDEVGVNEGSILTDLYAINNANMDDFKFLLDKEMVKEMEANGVNMRQIKKMKVVRRNVGQGKDKYEVQDVQIEMYDKLKAIETMAKIRKLYGDTTEINITLEQSLDKMQKAKEGILTNPNHVAEMVKQRQGLGSAK